VRLNVDLDAALTVLANGCFRWLSKQLHGFETAAPKQLFRKFVETSGSIEIEKNRIVVHFDKRSHNPILQEAALDQSNQKYSLVIESFSGLSVPIGGPEGRKC